MKGIFKKELWKDIVILVILLGVTFLRYTAFRDIPFIKIGWWTLTIICLVYAFFYTLYNCKTNKQRKWLVAIYSLSFLFMYWKDMIDVFIYLLIACIFMENRNKCLQTYFITSTLIICVAIICYFFGVVPKYNSFRESELRYSLGFVHPNTIFRFFFGNLMALYVLDKKKMWFNLYSIGMALPLFYLTNSRTGIIATFIFVLLSNLEIIFRKVTNKFDLRLGFLIATIFSLIVIQVWHNHEALNEFLSGRLRIIHDLLHNAKGHLLYGNMHYEYCDNRVAYLIIRNGLFALLIVNVFYYFVFRKETTNELKIIFVISMIYGLTENLRGLGQTIVPLLCLWSIYDTYIKKKKNDKNLQKIVNNDNI